MSDPTILACPFCGHAGLAFEQGSTFRWLAYSCGGCGMGSETRIQTMGEGTPEQWREQAERDAVDAWNRRAAASALPVSAEPPHPLPGFIRRPIEEAIHAATHPKGMSIHDGKMRIASDKVAYLLAAYDRLAALASREQR